MNSQPCLSSQTLCCARGQPRAHALKQRRHPAAAASQKARKHPRSGALHLSEQKLSDVRGPRPGHRSHPGNAQNVAGHPSGHPKPCAQASDDGAAAAALVAARAWQQASGESSPHGCATSCRTAAPRKRSQYCWLRVPRRAALFVFAIGVSHASQGGDCWQRPLRSPGWGRGGPTASCRRPPQLASQLCCLADPQVCLHIVTTRGSEPASLQSICSTKMYALRPFRCSGCSFQRQKGNARASRMTTQQKAMHSAT